MIVRVDTDVLIDLALERKDHVDAAAASPAKVCAALVAASR